MMLAATSATARVSSALQRLSRDHALQFRAAAGQLAVNDLHGIRRGRDVEVEYFGRRFVARQTQHAPLGWSGAP